MFTNQAVRLYDNLSSELGQHISEMNLDPYVRIARLINCLYDAYVRLFISVYILKF
jgi:hypothetical protein